MEGGDQLSTQTPAKGDEPWRSRLMPWLIIGAAIIIAGVLLYIVVGKNVGKKPSSDQGGSAATTGAASQLYETLGSAAKQPKIRVGMYRTTYANKADADAKQNPGTIASSVSEVDTVAGKYRSVFAHNLLQDDKTFSVGRCIDHDTYNEAYNTPLNHDPRATSLQNIAPHLALAPQGHLYKVTEPLVFISCPHLGLLPSSPPLAVSRLSDGVFPVTLTQQQAAKWTAKMKQVNLFEVKDEGMVEHSGKQLKKISFAPKNDSLTVSKSLYDIFYQAGEIDKIKREQPKAEWQYEFVAINPVNSGSVGGFYLIDEKTNLPVYSELYGTNPDKQTNASRAAGQNIARTKQTYAYPSGLTMDLYTPLEFLE